jgi:hypothetical protein
MQKWDSDDPLDNLSTPDLVLKVAHSLFHLVLQCLQPLLQMVRR